MRPGKTVCVIFLVALMALAVVWQSARMRRVGYRIDELRGRLRELRAERASYRTHLSKLKNPGRITALVAWLGLELQQQRQSESASPELVEPVPRDGGSPLTVAQAPRDDR